MSADKIDQQILADLRTFDFLAQKIWPALRVLFKNSITPRCKICILSSKALSKPLNEKGVCHLCEEHARITGDPERKRWLDRYVETQKKELHKLLSSNQGKGRNRYDALVLFSGGKDSVYILSRIKKEYPGLRLLLMTWDNGFYSTLSLEATKKIAKQMDLDLMTYSPVTGIYKTLYRYTLQNVGQKGSYGTVDRLDGTLNQLLGMHFAYQFEIPLVLTGVDWAQSLIMQSQTYFDTPFEDLASRILVDRMERRSGFKIKDIFSEENQKLFWDGTDKERNRIPKYVLPFAAWRPSKKEVLEELDKEKLLLQKNSSPILTNNQVLSVMTVIDIRTIGYCSFEPEFCAMIRFNEQDPVYWRNAFECVEFLAKQKVIADFLSKKILKKLGLEKSSVGL